MANWTYRCYDSGGVKTLWQQWYDNNPDYRGEHDFIFDFLEQQDVWRTKTRTITGKKYSGLIEVKLTIDVQHRIFGCYSKGERRVFIILGTGFHKGKIYTPAKILDTVANRKKEIENGSAQSPICSRPR